MNLNDIPDKKNESLSEVWTLAMTPTMKRALQELREIHGKDVTKMMRGLIQKTLDSIKEDQGAS